MCMCNLKKSNPIGCAKGSRLKSKNDFRTKFTTVYQESTYISPNSRHSNASRTRKDTKTDITATNSQCYHFKRSPCPERIWCEFCNHR